jgi:hypothetical protein
VHSLELLLVAATLLLQLASAYWNAISQLRRKCVEKDIENSIRTVAGSNHPDLSLASFDLP